MPLAPEHRVAVERRAGQRPEQAARQAATTGGSRAPRRAGHGCQGRDPQPGDGEDQRERRGAERDGEERQVVGRPDLIGIKDINKPDHGDAVPIKDDEIPVFWACGVTPQSVVATAKPEFCITHYPGCMLVTDRRNSEFAIM